ncbi:MAG: ABC transporter ATP-binding protein [Kofleriaceae bacterium]
MLATLLRRFLRPYARELTIVAGFQLIASLASLYLPKLNADIIDRGVTVGDLGYILRTGAWMVAVAALQVACAITAVYYGARAAMGYGRDLRAALFGHIGAFSAREVGQFGAPSLITRTSNDVQQVQMLVLMMCTMMVMAPMTAIGGVVLALRADLSLSRLLLVAVPVMTGTIGVIFLRMLPQFRRMQPLIDVVNRVLREQIQGMRVIRAFLRERDEAIRFDHANEALTSTALRVGKLQAMIFPVVMLVFNTSSVAVLWFGSHRIASGALQIGEMTAFLAYLMQILLAAMIASFVSMMIPRAAVSADRIGEVLATSSSVAPPAAPVAASHRGVVELRGAEYRYPGAELPVLRDISFLASPGTVTAIIGGTGSGKSTLLQLIARWIDATAGEILVDDVEVKRLELEALWGQVGLVPQRAYLFSGTIASNLRYGQPDATEDELWAALETAQAREFVKELPLGLEAPVAQGGTNLSGGQRQRLAIARALLRRPKVYLFDDSFAALDLATEARLRAALRPWTADATVIVVAQRVASIERVDQILVLDDGALVGRGTHAELLETCETYQEIVASQDRAEVAA